MIGRIIGALNGYDARRQALLNDVIGNEDKYNSAAGVYSLSAQNDLINSAVRAVTEIAAAEKAARKNVEKNLAQIDTIA